MDVIFTEGAAWGIMIVQGIFAWVLWSLRHMFARADAVHSQQQQSIQARQELHTRIMHLEGRLRGMEERIGSLPDSDALQALSSSVQSLRGDIKTLDARITGMDRLIVRLERIMERQAGIWQIHTLPAEVRS